MLRTAIGVNGVDVVAAVYLSRCSLERKWMTTESHELFFGGHKNAATGNDLTDRTARVLPFRNN